MLSVGDEVGKYRIKQSLGKGNFGSVYLARDRALGRDVALKVIPTNNADAMKDIVEAQRQTLCAHDNCVRVHSAEVNGVGSNLVVLIDMEFLPGGSLQAKMERESLSVYESVQHVAQILYALEHAHGAGIFHRDVKPANILLGQPHTKLSDFGIAAQAGGAASMTYVSHAAPEIIRGGAPSVVAEVFSAGLTLFRLVNNLDDWERELNNLPDWEEAVERGSLISEIGFKEYVPEKVRSVIRKACHADQNRRFPTCRDLRQALERLRFERDWRYGNGIWTSTLNGKTIEMQLLNKNIVYKINSRRKNSECRSFGSLGEAKSHLLDVIKNTTLRA